jgi:hypothetical protein
MCLRPPTGRTVTPSQSHVTGLCPDLVPVLRRAGRQNHWPSVYVRWGPPKSPSGVLGSPAQPRSAGGRRLPGLQVLPPCSTAVARSSGPRGRQEPPCRAPKSPPSPTTQWLRSASFGAVLCGPHQA